MPRNRPNNELLDVIYKKHDLILRLSFNFCSFSYFEAIIM